MKFFVQLNLLHRNAIFKILVVMILFAIIIGVNRIMKNFPYYILYPNKIYCLNELFYEELAMKKTGKKNWYCSQFYPAPIHICSYF